MNISHLLDLANDSGGTLYLMAVLLLVALTVIIDRMRYLSNMQTGGEQLIAQLKHTDPQIDFAAHAASLGAHARKAADLSQLEAALEQARVADRTCVIVIETDPDSTTDAGGTWWDVAVPEVSGSKSVMEARAAYEVKITKLSRGN